VVEPRSSEDASTPRTARIGPDSWQRLRGSYSSTAPAFRRRGDIEGPKPLPPLPPAISTPDIGIQIRDTRGSGPSCLSEEGRQQIVDAIRAAIVPKYPDADIRSTCQDAGTSKEAASFGIWTGAALSEIDSQGRDTGVGSLDLLEGTETAGFFVNATFIRVLAQQAWDDMPANRRLNGDGQPDPNGPVHLTSLTVTLEAPDAVVTRIDGVDTRPWPDVNFTITITDQIAAKFLQLTCTSNSKLDADTGWFGFLDFVFGIASLVSPWFALGFAIFFFEGVAVAGASAPQESGVGCAMLQLLPPRIPIAGGQDVLFFYDRATVTAGGLFVGAVIDQMARTPSASIVGPSQLAANISDGSVGGTFQAFGDDVRGNLTYVWGGDGEVLSPGLQATMIVFAIGGANVGTFMTKNITVSITDEDGLTASAAVTVEIHVTDMSDTTILPICRVKPWLPICGPPG